MIKTALKFNIVLFMLILIVSIPLVYADWSDLTVIVDTNVPTYEEVAFIQKYKGLYYIDYFNGKPYILTDDNIYNQYFVTDYYIRPVDIDFDRDGNRFYVESNPDCNYSCFLIIDFDVDSEQYLIEFLPFDFYDDELIIYGVVSDNRFLIERKRVFSESVYVNVNNALDYEQIQVRIFVNKYRASFILNVYKSNHIIDYIDRPAQTYTYEHSDYTRIGAIILDSYNQFVDSLLNPLDTISGWLKDLANYIWSTIKRIIDPEGIFLK